MMKQNKMSRPFVYLGVLFFAVPLSACAVSGDPSSESMSEAEPEPFDSVEEKLEAMRATGLLIEDEDELEIEKAPSFQSFYAGGGRGNIVDTGLSATASICMLSEIGGYLQNTPSSSDLSSFLSFFEGGTATHRPWKLRSYNNQLMGTTCTSHSNFQGPAGSGTWVSYKTNLYSANFGSENANLWQGDSFHFVAGAGGLYGSGESAETSQPSGSAFSVLRVDNDRWPTAAYGAAYSYFVGVPGQYRRVKLYGYRNGSWVRGDSASSGTFEFQVSTVSGYSAFWLPPTDKAICSITRVAGNFNGWADDLYYLKNGNNWYGTIVGADDAYGTFRCMAFDQR